ncbi:MAG: PTS sugar transporter subunit IIA [Desulfobacterota bacterium]|nr:PTS sugar transporter subunit IIA [Thermodesulfobacteriota bacterium]
MKQLINQLIQLQVLNFTLDEQKALTSDTYLKDLEASIKKLADSLPPDILKLFTQLSNKYSTAVVPMTKGTCSGCGMAVPTILAYEVKLGEKIIQCPRCARILFYRDSLPRQLKRVTSGGKPASGLERFSCSRLMVPQLQGKTRDEIIREMIELMAAEGFVEKPDALFESALNREAIVPTAVEHGLAFPHVRGIEGGGLIFAAGLKKQGVHFGAPKNRLTKIIFFIVIPLAASAFYLNLITGLMQTFSDADARERLLDCKTPEKMWQVLNQLTKKTIP